MGDQYFVEYGLGRGRELEARQSAIVLKNPTAGTLKADEKCRSLAAACHANRMSRIKASHRRAVVVSDAFPQCVHQAHPSGCIFYLCSTQNRISCRQQFAGRMIVERGVDRDQLELVRVIQFISVFRRQIVDPRREDQKDHADCHDGTGEKCDGATTEETHWDMITSQPVKENKIAHDPAAGVTTSSFSPAGSPRCASACRWLCTCRRWSALKWRRL